MPFTRKIRRRIIWAALALILSGFGFLAILRAPAVQTRIVRWAATQGEGWSLDVARVSMGLAGGEARGLIFTMPGVVARAEPGVELRLRPGRFLFGGQELHVERASASGIRIVVTPSEIEPSKTPFLGVLDLMRSPLPWVIGEARMDAEIELRDAGTDVAKARLLLKGGGLTAARAGEFEYEIEAASRFLPPSSDALVRSKGVLRVRQDRAHGVEEMELSGDWRTPAYGPLRVPPGKFVLRVERTAAGERYSGRVGFGEGEEATAEFVAEFDRAGRRLAGSVSGELDARLAAWAGLATEGWPEDKARWSADYTVGVDDGRVSARLVAGRAREPELVVVETKTGADATVELRGLPLAWLGRWTEARGLAWEPGSRADGAWRITRAGVAGARVETLRPLVVAGLRARDGLEPPLPAARVEVDFSAEASAKHVELDLRGLRLVVAGEEGAEARLAARARWNLAEGGGVVEALRAEWLERAGAAPALIWTSGAALDLDAKGRPLWAEGVELGRLEVRELRLDGMGRWLAASGIAVAGTWTSGAAVLRSVDATGGLELRAEEPWRFEKLRVVEAGEERAAGELALRPELKRDGAGRWSGRVDKLRWAEAAGRRVEGALEGTWNEADGAYSGAVDLLAALPAGDPGPVEAGPLTVTLKAKAGVVAPKVGQIEELALVVSGANGELASLRSAGAWLYVRRPNGELLANSLGAWVLKTAAMPLAWAGPYLPPGLEVAGDLQAFEGLLTTTLGIYQVRPLRLLSVRGLTVKREGEIVVNDADCSFYPGFDLRVAHALRPKFALAWEASAHATDGTVETRGRRALQFELAGGAVGDTEVALPKTIDLVLRGEVAALRALLPVAAARLPAAGRFVARADGDMLGTEPMRIWARVDDVPAPGGGRMLAPLEAEARGKVDGRARVANFDVALRMGEGPAAGDLAFAVRFAPGEGTLRIDSTLRGRRWDLTETQAWAKALGGVETPPTTAGEEAAADAGAAPRVATSIGGPVWGPLRGSFELELGELLLAPYRVEKLRGRAELDEQALTVTGLGGEMFSGRLGGDLTLRHEPGVEGGDHALRADFSIQQFDTARVVQEVFPNEFGMLDARVDLRAAVRGRGFRLWDLTERAEADFTVEGKGVARLTHPDARTASTLLVMGGMITLSPELRALGRLLRKFAEMPVDDLRLEGGRSADGALHLSRVRLDSPQARLEGTGEVSAMEGVALPARPLKLRLGLSARDETGLILGRMRLLEKGADAEGYRRVARTVEVRGEAGRPDASELYDLLARGAAGSRGTWGLIMRRVQREVERQQAKEAKDAGTKKPKQPEEAAKQT